MVSLLLGTANRVETVVGRASWNVDAWLANADERPPTFGRNVLDALLAATGR